MLCKLDLFNLARICNNIFSMFYQHELTFLNHFSARDVFILVYKVTCELSVKCLI